MGIGRDILYAVGLAAASPVWATAMLRTGKWRTDWAGRFGRAEPRAEAESAAARGRTLLICAVSVGEVNAIRDLVRELEADPGLRLVIATTTNTGIARATALFAERHEVVRYPLDFTFAVGRFLDAIRPDAVALVELEVWPNFVDACEARGVPVAVINGRISDRSFPRYRKVRGLLRGTFGKLAAAAMQTPTYAERMVELGVPRERVHVLDTMKWDTAEVADDVPGSDELARAMGIDRSRPVVVAGSTAPGEERLLIEGRLQWPEGTQLVLVPRKPEWFPLARDVVRARGERIVLRSEGYDAASSPGRPELFLLDTIGELRKAYALADVVVVGRSFVKLYGSDMMEPIALGKPTVVGPHYADFRDTVEALVAAGGIVVTDDPGPAVARLLADGAAAGELARRGRDVILSRQGSTRRHAELLRGLLPGRGERDEPRP